MTRQRLTFANFLAPALFNTYQYITVFIEQYSGIPTRLISATSSEDFVSGHVDGGFICGLAYTRLAEQHPQQLEVSAAPILQGERYQQKPHYFSDMIVRKQSNFTSFQDLQGSSWAYNEKASHSGYNIVYHRLLERGYSAAFFGQTIESGSHAQSLHMVLDGQADTAAIDSHVLDFTWRHNPEIADRLRVIDALGPSTIPPVIVAARLDASIKQQIREALLTIHQDPFFAQKLHDGVIERFTSIEDAHYDDVRQMYKQVQTSFIVR
jgi:phosphonate transport system substrate-binding protein